MTLWKSSMRWSQRSFCGGEALVADFGGFGAAARGLSARPGELQQAGIDEGDLESLFGEEVGIGLDFRLGQGEVFLLARGIADFDILHPVVMRERDGFTGAQADLVGDRADAGCIEMSLGRGQGGCAGGKCGARREKFTPCHEGIVIDRYGVDESQREKDRLAGGRHHTDRGGRHGQRGEFRTGRRRRRGRRHSSRRVVRRSCGNWRQMVAARRAARWRRVPGGCRRSMCFTRWARSIATGGTVNRSCLPGAIAGAWNWRWSAGCDDQLSCDQYGGLWLSAGRGGGDRDSRSAAAPGAGGHDGGGVIFVLFGRTAHEVYREMLGVAGDPSRFAGYRTGDERIAAREQASVTRLTDYQSVRRLPTCPTASGALCWVYGGQLAASNPAADCGSMDGFRRSFRRTRSMQPVLVHVLADRPGVPPTGADNQ